jgi:hypothetical protein
MAIICPRGGTAPRTQRERAELAADLDRAAGHLWQRGNYRAAASLISQARALDPARADLWAKREDAITQAASGGQPGRQREAEAEAEDGSPGRTPRNGLERQLAEAGIAPDDPALEFWRAWNLAACKRRDGDAGDADREAGQ